MGAEIEKVLIKIKVQKCIEFWSTRRAEDGDPGTHGGDFGGSLLPTVRKGGGAKGGEVKVQ